MKKVAVVTDSNSGITQVQANELGVFVLPMPVLINGNEYFEGVTISQEQFFECLNDDAEVSTSQPAPGEILQLWDKVLIFGPKECGALNTADDLAKLGNTISYEVLTSITKRVQRVIE